MKLLSLLSLATIAVASPTLLSRSAVPPVDSVSIKGVVYGGSGCPQKTADPIISKDGKSITIDYDSSKYTAFQHKSSSVADSRKNCQITLKLEFPSGWSYSVAETSYAGHVKLDKGVTATQTINYYFSGETDQVTQFASFQGPVDKDFVVVDTIAYEKNVWSSCSSSTELLNVNSALRVEGDGNGRITIDKSKSAFVISLNWKAC
ncbi:hypothetical protein BJ508DRAFT_417294 [Ascobolus immersus RN42]|uniref:Secreted protein n=1 Tax=Ascobolus immersus RN42 TaxID=1160509 RepID=A0A3N4HTD0_ASCIM|nr:hypothetical protein BJ508DRAFT_417294 [Ascobolus immersus RN42]